MKLYNIKNVNAFCDVINSCKGQISLITKDGQAVNLKDRLNEFVALSKYFGKGEIPEIEIKAEHPLDVLAITQYLMTA